MLCYPMISNKQSTNKPKLLLPIIERYNLYTIKSFICKQVNNITLTENVILTSNYLTVAV